MTSPPGMGRDAVDHAFRQHYARLCAALTRTFGPGRLDLVEDVVQDALVQAMRTWPFSGTPDNPAAWLTTVAHRLAIDALRKQATADGHVAERIRELADRERNLEGGESDDEHEIADDTLRMIFTCCHPALPRDARVALTLKTLCGFGVREIASALLAKESAVAQRLSRAKAKLQREGIRFTVPGRADIPRRVESALEVLYLLFNEGYRAHAGAELVRLDLVHEAIRLTHAVEQAPLPENARPATHALLALMHFLGARIPARMGSDGTFRTLAEQDRSLWDRDWLRVGFSHLSAATRGERITRYHVEASIASIHAIARRYEDTDWPRILQRYDAMLELAPSRVVRLNRSVAIAKVHGVRIAREELDALEGEDAMRRYPLFWATRAHFAWLAGETERALDGYDRALELPMSEPERALLTRRRLTCAAGGEPPQF